MRTAHVRKLVTTVSFVPQVWERGSARDAPHAPSRSTHTHGCVPLPLVQGIFLLALSARVLDSPSLIVALLLLVAPLNIASNGGGYAVNHLDIAPAVASLVLAFYNTGGQVRSRDACMHAGSPSTTRAAR